MTAEVAAGEMPEVIVRAQAGDPAAIAQLYEEYWGLIYRFCYRRTSNSHTAEDLATDVFVRMIKRIEVFEWRGQNVGAWLLVVARNIVADMYKSHRYTREVYSGGGIDYAEELKDADVSPEERALVTLDAKATSAAITWAMKKLSPEQQQVLRLRFVEELSIKDAAVALDTTEGAVKALTYRAVRSMKRVLEEEGSPWPSVKSFGV